MTNEEAQKIVDKINLLLRVTTKRGATQNEAVTALKMIEHFRAKLSGKPSEEPVCGMTGTDLPPDYWRTKHPTEVQIAEGERIMQRERERRRKEYESMNLGNWVSPLKEPDGGFVPIKRKL